MRAESITHQPSSPTLKEGQHYLSLIAHVPNPLAHRLTEWKRQQGIIDTPTAHVTVYVREIDEWVRSRAGWRSDAFASALRDVGPVRVRMNETKSFHPITEVTYLSVDEQGSAGLHALHAVCVRSLGQWATPFPYVPHMTLARDLNEVQVANARATFEALPVAEREFTVDTLHAYSYDGTEWEPLGQIDLVKR